MTKSQTGKRQKDSPFGTCQCPFGHAPIHRQYTIQYIVLLAMSSSNCNVLNKCQMDSAYWRNMKEPGSLGGWAGSSTMVKASA